MKFLSSKECSYWLSRARISKPTNRLPTGSEGVEFSIPEESTRVNSLTAALIGALPSDCEVLLEITGWSVWPSREYLALFYLIRSKLGEDEPLIDRPGHLFERRERDELQIFVYLAILFLWDAYICAADGTTVLLSHDEFGWFESPSPDLLEKLSSALEWLELDSRGQAP